MLAWSVSFALDMVAFKKSDKTAEFLMDQERKIRLELAMAAWKAKGNKPLTEACVIALESDQAQNRPPKAAWDLTLKIYLNSLNTLNIVFITKES